MPTPSLLSRLTVLELARDEINQVSSSVAVLSPPPGRVDFMKIAVGGYRSSLAGTGRK